MGATTPRDAARLLALRRADGPPTHRAFRDLPEYHSARGPARGQRDARQRGASAGRPSGGGRGALPAAARRAGMGGGRLGGAGTPGPQGARGERLPAGEPGLAAGSGAHPARRAGPCAFMPTAAGSRTRSRRAGRFALPPYITGPLADKGGTRLVHARAARLGRRAHGGAAFHARPARPDTGHGGRDRVRAAARRRAGRSGPSARRMSERTRCTPKRSTCPKRRPWP